nr:hypothetical protein BaRGS_007792 [Batillaria attramentaria]
MHLDKGSDDPGNENTTLFIEKSWDFYDCAHKCKTAENVTCEAFFFDKSASNCYGYEDALNDTLMTDHNGDSYGQRVNC